MIDLTSSCQNESQDLYRSWKESGRLRGQVLVLFLLDEVPDVVFAGLEEEEPGADTEDIGLLEVASKGFKSYIQDTRYVSSIRNREAMEWSRFVTSANKVHRTLLLYS